MEDLTSIQAMGLSACSWLHTGSHNYVAWAKDISEKGVPRFLKSWDPSKGGCNFFTFEKQRAVLQNLTKPALDAVPDVNVTELVLLREPTTHVPSMFMHCQMGTGLERHNYTRINISQWLSAYDEGSVANAWDVCGYRPRDKQVCVLGDCTIGEEHVKPQMAEALGRARAVVRNAYFVGILEYYGLSLCVLNVKLHGLSKAPTGCQCKEARAEPKLKETHRTHGTQPEYLTLTGADIGAIGRLTANDRILYSEGLLRFLTEVEEAGLSCWLEAEPADATDRILLSLGRL